MQVITGVCLGTAFMYAALSAFAAWMEYKDLRVKQQGENPRRVRKNDDNNDGAEGNKCR